MAVYLVTYSGTLLNGQEQFSHTLAFDDTGTHSEERVLDAAEAGIEAFLSSSGVSAIFSSLTAWTNVSAARVLNLATGTLFAKVSRTLALTGSNGTANHQLPPQLAIAVSLRGGPKPNGTPYRGRFFLPAPHSQTLASGILGADVRTDLLNGVVAWMQDATAEISGVAPQVWSRKDALTSTVEAVAVGRAVDTIRSRRRDLAESKSFTSV